MLPKEVKDIVDKPLESYELKKISPSIFHINVEKQAELALTFLRFQEYYESPKYKDKIFSLEEFAQWYTKEHSEDGKNFDYHKEWNGFNIPSKVLKPFYEGKFDLTEKEKTFLDIFKDNEGDFYIIGTHSEKDPSYYDGLLKHETAHGLFYTDNEYRDSVRDILKDVDLKELSKVFSKMGYHESVHLDESHAYLLADTDSLKDDEGIDINKYKEVTESLNKLFINTVKKYDSVAAVEYHIKYEAKKEGFTVDLVDDDMVKISDSIKVAGYFDHSERILKAGTKNKNYLTILIHEFCHMEQMIEDCPSWKDCFVMGTDMDTLIDLWLEKKIELSEEQLKEYTNRLIDVERDCGQRTVEKIKEFNLDIDPKEYTKAANSYLMMYHRVAKERRWCERTPRDNKKVLSLVSDKFDMDYSSISEDLLGAYDETFI